MPWVRDTAWPHIDPGKLIHKISIQSSSPTQDAYGQQQSTWVNFFQCRGAIETMSTKEQFQGGFVSEVVHRVTIRWPGPQYPIEASMRIVVDPIPGGQATVFQIQSVENVQQRNLIVRIVCVEIDNATVTA